MCLPFRGPDLAASVFATRVGRPVTRRYVGRGGRRLGLLETGDGDLPVVFEAGMDSSVLTFVEVFKSLAGEFRLIGYDRAGYGVSGPAPWSVSGQVDDLIAVLEVSGPAVLVGHSWGGLLAQLAAWTRPDLIRGLVLLDPSHEDFCSGASADDASPDLTMILRSLGELAARRRPEVPVVLMTLGQPSSWVVDKVAESVREVVSLGSFESTTSRKPCAAR